MTAERILHRWNAIAGKIALLDARHDPGGYQSLNQSLEIIVNNGEWIEKRSRLQVEDGLNGPFSEEAQSDKQANEDQQPPTSAQAARIQEDGSRAEGRPGHCDRFLIVQSQRTSRRLANI